MTATSKNFGGTGMGGPTPENISKTLRGSRFCAARSNAIIMRSACSILPGADHKKKTYVF